MEFITEPRPLADYLLATDTIDHQDPKIQFVVNWLQDQMIRSLDTSTEQLWPDPEMQLASLAYQFVRDKIAHSADQHSTRNVWVASEVLQKREGLCYGKSHLLAALLRCSGIPAGLCYQYLRRDASSDSPLILHSLNAVYFQSVDHWFRLDARGNRPGVDAQFSLDEEKIAFQVRPALGETDLPLIFSDVDRAVQVRLQQSETLDDLMARLPARLFGHST